MSLYAYGHNISFEVIQPSCCNLPFMMTLSMYDERLRTKKTWYCPNCGSSRVFNGETEESKLKKELAKEVQRKEAALRRANEARIEADKMRAKEEVQRKSKLRMKNRIKHGVCPCCNRTFKNLQNHMKSKHADFVSNRESLLVIRESMELSQTKLAKSLDISPGYISSYEHNKYLPEYARDILDKFVEENG